MNDIKVTIMYRDGQEETCYVTDHSIKNGCLSLYKRYKETRYIPLDTIKEWKVKQPIKDGRHHIERLFCRNQRGSRTKKISRQPRELPGENPYIQYDNNI